MAIDLTRLEAQSKAATGDAVVSIQNVTKRFGGHTVLQDITFDVPRGKTSAILGPSGTGKSVLLKTIIGLLRPEAGQIYVDGEPIVGMREKQLLRVRRKFGVLFQDGALFGSMSLYDNISFPLVEHTNKTDREVRDIVLQKAELVGLVAHLHKFPAEVSGGMRKRAGLARALVLDPEIIFFDEPDSGLDPVRTALLCDLIREIQRKYDSTAVVISHDIKAVFEIADHIVLLHGGKVVEQGPKEKLKESENSFTSQFLAGAVAGPLGMD
jgi:phospholipid/cholesterol/gamma-HCH transport system ATP-binding protein